MNITKFKEGDVITRNAPMTYAHSGDADGSYMGTKFTFVGVDTEAKMIVLHEDGKEWKDGVTTLAYGRDRWDEGWAYFPTSLVEKAKKLFKGKTTK